MIITLDNALAHYARIIARDLDMDVLNLAGGGAAGGMGRRCTPSAVRSCARALRSSPMRYIWLTRLPMRIW